MEIYYLKMNFEVAHKASKTLEFGLRGYSGSCKSPYLIVKRQCFLN